MKKGTVILALSLLLVFVLYKTYKKPGSKENPIETITVSEPLYADDYSGAEIVSYYVPVGSVIKEYNTYYEIIMSDTNEMVTLKKA